MNAAAGSVSPIDAVDLFASLLAVIAPPAIRSEVNEPVVIFAASRSGMSPATRSTAAVM